MTKIATWNVNSLKVRLGHVLDWLAAEKPDVLALQETKTIDENFPGAEIEAAGYHTAFAGQKTYNGVATLSLAPSQEVVTDLPGLDDPHRRILASTIDGIRVLNVYVPNGKEVGSESYAYKLDWLEKLRDYVEAELSRHPKLVVLGDFNIAPEDRDVHDPDEWQGKILCSDPERAALQALLDLGLSDLFRLFEQEKRLFSWWDYRRLGFRRNHGLRIDLILGSSALAKACTASRIDKEPRKLERPSDHTPAVAELDL
jgi:exodeoxyribonuclease-3